MTRSAAKHGSVGLLAVALIGFAWPCQLALADRCQGRPHPEADSPTDTSQPVDGPAATWPAEGPRGHGPPDHRPGPGPGWHRLIFEPTEEDTGPLAPGEEEALHKFVNDELPRLAVVLRRIEAENPRGAEKGFARLVPKLRLLRRIHAENPELADLIEQHAANMFRVEMLRRGLGRGDGDRRDVIEGQIRTCLAENVRIEASALEHWADDLQTHREQRLAQRAARLISGKADLAFEPQEIRDMVAAIGAATDDAQRHAQTEQLNKLLGQQMDRELSAIRKRAQQLRDNAPEEVDRRAQRLLEAGGPHHHRP